MRASESWHNFWICSRKKKDDRDKAANSKSISIPPLSDSAKQSYSAKS
jgi:hypothetical protein